MTLTQEWRRPKFWTEARKRRLVELETQGIPHEEIAMDLRAASVLAIQSQLQRMGYSRRKNPRVKQHSRPLRQISEPDHEPLHIGLEQLTPRTCKYPYGDRDFTFCGHETKCGNSWCDYHKGVVFNAKALDPNWLQAGEPAKRVLKRVAR